MAALTTHSYGTDMLNTINVLDRKKGKKKHVRKDVTSQNHVSFFFFLVIQIFLVQFHTHPSTTICLHGEREQTTNKTL